MTTMAEAGDQGAIIDFAMAPRINSESRWLHRISRLYSCAGNEDELFSALLESILAEAETDHGFLALIEDGALRIAALRGAAASRGSGTNRLVLWAMEQSTVVLDGHIPGSPSPDSIPTLMPPTGVAAFARTAPGRCLPSALNRWSCSESTPRTPPWRSKMRCFGGASLSIL
jgi:hypothetical protein